MLHEQADHQQQAPVIVVGSAAEAELVATTLRVSGLAATCTIASAFPSLEWAEGYAVAVTAADAAAATDLLRGLGHVPLVDGDAGEAR